MQSKKDDALEAIREAIGKPEDFQRLPKTWLSALKLHAATLPLAEFAAVVGNLRGARWAARFLKRYRADVVMSFPPRPVQAAMVALLGRS